MQRSRMSILGHHTTSEAPPTPLQQQSEEFSVAASQQLASVGSFLSHVVTPMWRMATQRTETPPPRVLLVDEQRARRKSWASADGCITGLSQYERITLNAMEQRVLPPDVRIKIAVAQANAGEDREEKMEADMKRLDGLVRTLALYAILERRSIAPSKTADRIAPDRVRVLGKMLVAAVQLELFQMLDEICETGDMENELFDDLCCDTIQEGRRNGFVMLTPEVLLSPGSGYKRLLQIRKDQFVEEIADVAGIRGLAGHDCNKSPTNSEGSTENKAGVNSKCDSPTGGSNSYHVHDHADGGNSNVDMSPSGHRRTHTQRVQDLLNRVDGLVDDVAQSSEEQATLNALADLPPLSPSGLTWRRSGSGGGDSSSMRSGTRSHRSGVTISSGGVLVSLGDGHAHRVSSADGTSGTSSREQHDQQQRAFFPDEGNDAHPCSDPFALAEGRFHPPPLPAETSTQSRLLSEVDWLIAGTLAALGDEELESHPALTPTKLTPTKLTPSKGDGDVGKSPENAGPSAEGDGGGVSDTAPDPAAIQAALELIKRRGDGEGGSDEVSVLPSTSGAVEVAGAEGEVSNSAPRVSDNGDVRQVGDAAAEVKVAASEVDPAKEYSSAGSSPPDEKLFEISLGSPGTSGDVVTAAMVAGDMAAVPSDIMNVLSDIARAESNSQPTEEVESAYPEEVDGELASKEPIVVSALDSEDNFADSDDNYASVNVRNVFEDRQKAVATAAAPTREMDRENIANDEQPLSLLPTAAEGGMKEEDGERGIEEHTAVEKEGAETETDTAATTQEDEGDGEVRSAFAILPEGSPLESETEVGGANESSLMTKHLAKVDDAVRIDAAHQELTPVVMNGGSAEMAKAVKEDSFAENELVVLNDDVASSSISAHGDHVDEIYENGGHASETRREDHTSSLTVTEGQSLEPALGKVVVIPNASSKALDDGKASQLTSVDSHNGAEVNGDRHDGEAMRVQTTSPAAPYAVVKEAVIAKPISEETSKVSSMAYDDDTASEVACVDGEKDVEINRDGHRGEAVGPATTAAPLTFKGETWNLGCHKAYMVGDDDDAASEVASVDGQKGVEVDGDLPSGEASGAAPTAAPPVFGAGTWNRSFQEACLAEDDDDAASAQASVDGHDTIEINGDGNLREDSPEASVPLAVERKPVVAESRPVDSSKGDGGNRALLIVEDDDAASQVASADGHEETEVDEDGRGGEASMPLTFENLGAAESTLGGMRGSMDDDAASAVGSVDDTVPLVVAGGDVLENTSTGEALLEDAAFTSTKKLQENPAPSLPTQEHSFTAVARSQEEAVAGNMSKDKEPLTVSQPSAGSPAVVTAKKGSNATAIEQPQQERQRQRRQSQGSSRSSTRSPDRRNSPSISKSLRSTGFKTVNLVGGGVTQHKRRERQSPPLARSIAAPTSGVGDGRAYSSSSVNSSSNSSSSSRHVGMTSLNSSLRVTGFKSVNLVGGGSTSQQQQSRDQKGNPHSSISTASADAYADTAAFKRRSRSSGRPKKSVNLKPTGFKSVSLAPSLSTPGQETSAVSTEHKLQQRRPSNRDEGGANRDGHRMRREPVTTVDVPDSVVGRADVEGGKGEGREASAGTTREGLVSALGPPGGIPMARGEGVEASLPPPPPRPSGATVIVPNREHHNSGVGIGGRVEGSEEETPRDVVLTDVSLEDEAE